MSLTVRQSDPPQLLSITLHTIDLQQQRGCGVCELLCANTQGHLQEKQPVGCSLSEPAAQATGSAWLCLASRL